MDEELSGHLGLTEWVMFFHLTSSSVHENESFRLFNQLDMYASRTTEELSATLSSLWSGC